MSKSCTTREFHPSCRCFITFVLQRRRTLHWEFRVWCLIVRRPYPLYQQPHRFDNSEILHGSRPSHEPTQGSRLQWLATIQEAISTRTVGTLELQERVVMKRPQPIREPRTYLVDIGGRIYQRNREHLQPRTGGVINLVPDKELPTGLLTLACVADVI